MEISRSIEVRATPEAAYDLVSDLPGMGALSPENVGGRWLGGATGPVAGARFRGRNRNGLHRWSTSVRVVTADPGREFAFDVSSYRFIPVSRRRYTFLPTADGCTVTEGWQDRRPGWFKLPAGVATGVLDRESATGRSIEHTLASLKAALEG
jgi:hypothetical protein